MGKIKEKILKVLALLLYIYIYKLLSLSFGAKVNYINSLTTIFAFLYIFEGMFVNQRVLIWGFLKKIMIFFMKFIIIIGYIDLSILPKYTALPGTPKYQHQALDFSQKIELIMIFVLVVFLLEIIVEIALRRIYKKNLVIIGKGGTAKKLINRINNNKFLGYFYIGYIDVDDILENKQKRQISEKKKLGNFSELDKILASVTIDEVILAIPHADTKEIHLILEKLEKYKMTIKYIPRLNGTYTFNTEVNDYDGLLIVTANRNKRTYFEKYTKRAFDILGGLVGMFVLGIIYLIIGRKIKADGGKAMYTQTRIGKDLKPFKMYKFRSMYSDADERLQKMLADDEKLREEFYTNFKLKDDPRITKIGKFIRKTSIDELPQLINVLKGEMSLVGPRPIVQKEVDLYYGSERGQKVFSVKPGLTGMWQAHGRSDVEDYDERIALDIYYIRNRSIWLDIVIIMKTMINLKSADGAY